MIFIILFLTELLILFLLSKHLTNLLFTFFYKYSKNQKISIYLLSLLFLPGTILHELSHAFMALILNVRFGEIELMPKLTDHNLKLGSIQIAKSDPVRRLLIGAGPFIFGTGLLILSFFYAEKYNLLTNPLSIAFAFYIVFEIGNTMFSSRKDMEGALELIMASTIIILILYLLGLRLPEINPDIIFKNQFFLQVIKKTNIFLLAPLGIDFVLIAILKVFLSKKLLTISLRS